MCNQNCNQGRNCACAPEKQDCEHLFMAEWLIVAVFAVLTYLILGAL